MALVSVRVHLLVPFVALPTELMNLVDVGWYDSVEDEELGTQPCMFKSITPVRLFTTLCHCRYLTPDRISSYILMPLEP